MAPTLVALQEAEPGAGDEILEDVEFGDENYRDTHKKMEHRHYHGDGTKSVIHYWENKKTGERSGFKFKDQNGTRGVEFYRIKAKD